MTKRTPPNGGVKGGYMTPSHHLSGWWFGTSILFSPKKLECQIIPMDELHHFSGRGSSPGPPTSYRWIVHERFTIQLERMASSTAMVSAVFIRRIRRRSMKLPNGEPRPLPNKVCAWLRRAWSFSERRDRGLFRGAVFWQKKVRIKREVYGIAAYVTDFIVIKCYKRVLVGLLYDKKHCL